jgi:hypothetical protein
MKTIKHTGEGNPIRVSADDNDPAHTAAAILARRMYGARGTVATLRLDSWAKDGSAHTYEAFIGRSPTAAERRRGANGVTGRNVWIYA